MNKITFPIISVENNEITNIKGEISYFYELIPPDIEQKTSLEIIGLYERIAGALNAFNGASFFKFYQMGGRSFLNTNYKNIYIPEVDIQSVNNPLELYFEGSDIYSKIYFEDNNIYFNGKCRRILSVKEFSLEEIDQNLIPKDHDYILIFKKKSKEKALSKLERIRHSYLTTFAKNKRDIEGEGAYQQTEELIANLIHDEESIFDMELYFLIDDYSSEQLHKRTIDLIEFYKGKGIKLFIEGQSFKNLKSGIGAIFTQMIPGVTPNLSMRAHIDKTGHLKYLLPLKRSYLMDGGIKFKDILCDDIFFDPFGKEFQNRNMLITGSSGSGKSVLVNKLVHCLIEDHPVVILDKGGSFKRLTFYHEGVELVKKFNPMQFRNPVFLRELILSLAEKNKFCKMEKGKLLKEIKTILEENKIESFIDLLKHLERSFVGISYYFENIKEIFTDQYVVPSNILYVDIDDFPKEATSPVILFIFEYFKNISQKEKILVFDEAWNFLKDHADYIDECFRTFRKTGTLPIAISQGLKDFTDSGELYTSIANNSYFKVFFTQDRIDDPNLDEFDYQMIQSLKYEKGIFSECYLRSSDKRFRKIIRIELTSLELELFHTEALEDDPLLRFLNDHRNYFSSNKETIDSYVRLKYEVV